MPKVMKQTAPRRDYGKGEVEYKVFGKKWYARYKGGNHDLNWYPVAEGSTGYDRFGNRNTLRNGKWVPFSYWNNIASKNFDETAKRLNNNMRHYYIKGSGDSILLKSAPGTLRGLKMDTGLLDSVMVNAGRAHLDIKPALGIPFKESTFGKYRDTGRPTDLISDWAYSNSGPYTRAASQIDHDYSKEKILDKEKRAKEVFDNIKPDELDEIESPLLHGFTMYRLDPKSYNPGNPNYPLIVEEAGTLIYNQPEFLNYYRTRGKALYDKGYREVKKSGGILKAEEGTTFQKVGDFINSDTGKSLISFGKDLYSGIRTSIRLSKLRDKYTKAIDANYKYLKNDIDEKSITLKANLELQLLLQSNPDINYGTVDLQAIQEKFRKEALNDSLKQANLYRQKALQSMEDLLLSIKGSGDTSNMMESLVNGVSGLYNMFLKPSNSSNSSYTYSKITSNNFSNISKPDFSVNMSL